MQLWRRSGSGHRCHLADRGLRPFLQVRQASSLTAGIIRPEYSLFI
jgi:hypothetical protein